MRSLIRNLMRSLIRNRLSLQIFFFLAGFIISIIDIISIIINPNIAEKLIGGAFNLKNNSNNALFVAPVIGILIAGSATFLLILIRLLVRAINNRKSDHQPLSMETSRVKEEALLRLEQQESELEKQKSDLEKKQQKLLWQMEAASIAKEDPRLAIVVAYQGLEGELRIVATRLPTTDVLEENDNQSFSILHELKLLEGHIDLEGLETIKQMQDLRNRIVHGEVNPKEVTPDKATELLQKAINISQKLSSIENNTSS